FDPATAIFTATSNTMTSVRAFHRATLLTNGKVLITGGFNRSIVNTAETFDFGVGTFSLAANTMLSRRRGHTATLLPTGSVLVTGGLTGTGPQTTAEFFDPS